MKSDRKMNFPKMNQKLVIVCIFLIYFVPPCYQNQHIKVANNNDKVSNLNQVANAKIIAARRYPNIAVPVKVSPQPLITRKKVTANPVKPKTKGNNIKSLGVSKKEDKQQKDTIQNKKVISNVDIEPKNEEKSTFLEDTDDIIIIPKKSNIYKSKANSIQEDNKSEEVVTQTNTESSEPEDKIHEKTRDDNEIVNSANLETHNTVRVPNNTKTGVQDEGNKEIKTEAKVKPIKKENSLPNSESNISGKQNASSSKNKAAHNATSTNNVESISTTRNSKTDSVVTTNKVHLNINPKLMKELTNDANDKIFIKNYDYEELHEKYNPPSKDIHKALDLKIPYDNPFKQKQDRFEDGDYINNPSTDFKYEHYRTPTDRIWRKWKNSEIHVKSNDFKDIETITTEEPTRDICDCYSNNYFNPVEYIPDKFEPDYESVYPTMIQKPNYYLPPTTSYQACYQPKTYGNQYAPVSRYQNYLFPCLY